MKAKSEYPTLHAGQHEPEGSDALLRAVWLDYDNNGDYLKVTTAHDIRLVAITDLFLQSLAGATLAVRYPLFLIADGPTTNSASINVCITPTNFFLVRDTSTVTEYMRVGSAGAFVKLQTGGKFQVTDHLGASLFEVDENGTITPSGGAVASDVLWDAKGDLAVGTGSNTAAKLTVGSNDQLPVADSSQTTGIRWGGIDGGAA